MNILVKFKNLLVEALTENKKLIIGLYLLFIIVTIISWILLADTMHAALKSIHASQTTPIHNNSEHGLELFLHNEKNGIIVYFGSILFAIPAIVSLLYNAFVLGLLGQLSSIVLPNGALIYIFYILPHGIFEITAIILQSVSGILLFLFIFRFIKAMMSSETKSVSESFQKTKKVLIHSIILMIFSTILLLIAAPIETFVSVPFSEFMGNLLK